MALLLHPTSLWHEFCAHGTSFCRQVCTSAETDKWKEYDLVVISRLARLNFLLIDWDLPDVELGGHSFFGIHWFDGERANPSLQVHNPSMGMALYSDEQPWRGHPSLQSNTHPVYIRSEFGRMQSGRLLDDRLRWKPSIRA